IEDTANWNKAFDGNNGADNILSMALDSTGNIYVAGYGTTLANELVNDGWIKKFDSTGNEDTTNWNKVLFQASVVTGISLDSLGNVFVTGSVDLNSYGCWFIKKYDPSG